MYGEGAECSEATSYTFSEKWTELILVKVVLEIFVQGHLGKSGTLPHQIQGEDGWPSPIARGPPCDHPGSALLMPALE